MTGNNVEQKRIRTNNTFMEKRQAALIIETAFLNADGHIRQEDAVQYGADELTDAMRMAVSALLRNENQHVYVFMNDEEGGQIADLWTTSVPDIGEEIIIWKEGVFHYYRLRNRIYGANAEEKVGVWNLYVEPEKREG